MNFFIATDRLWARWLLVEIVMIFAVEGRPGFSNVLDHPELLALLETCLLLIDRQRLLECWYVLSKRFIQRHPR